MSKKLTARQTNVRSQLDAFESLGYLTWASAPDNSRVTVRVTDSAAELILDLHESELFLSGLATGAQGREKPKPPAALDDAEALGEALSESYAHTMGPISLHALRYLRALVLSVYPMATLVTTTDSDQGPGYFIGSIENAAGEELDKDHEDLEDDVWRPLSDMAEDEMDAMHVNCYAIELNSPEVLAAIAY